MRTCVQYRSGLEAGGSSPKERFDFFAFVEILLFCASFTPLVHRSLVHSFFCINFNMLERIVSLEPSITASLMALGQGHRLVAVTRYCSRLVPNLGDGIPQLETTWTVQADEVAALNPDLVIASIPFCKGKMDELLKAKLNVFCLYPQTLHDVYNHLIWLGQLCDASHKAQVVVSEMKTTFANLKLQAAGKPRLRVYVETWPTPATRNAEQWIAEMVELLGGEPVPNPPGRSVTEEEVIQADPEIIILNWAGMDTMDVERVLKRKGWENISAIRTKKVTAVNEIFLNAPGPNLAEGGRELYRAMYSS